MLHRKSMSGRFAKFIVAFVLVQDTIGLVDDDLATGICLAWLRPALKASVH
jgi:hypothetical protein